MHTLSRLAQQACHQVRDGNLLEAFDTLRALAATARTRDACDARHLAFDLHACAHQVLATLEDCGYAPPRLEQLSEGFARRSTRGDAIEEFQAAVSAIRDHLDAPSGIVSPTAERALRYIDANYQSPITPGSIAHRFRCSRGHLRRSLQASYGQSTRDLILECRMRRARTVLAATSRPIPQVAEDSGFGTARTLQRVFADHVGMTPSAYRQASRAA